MTEEMINNTEVQTEEIAEETVPEPTQNTDNENSPAQSEVVNQEIDGDDGNMSMLMGVQLKVAVELGRTNLSVKEVLDLQKGSVVELDRIAGDAVDLYINNTLIARGDVVVVDDKFGVRITEILPAEKRT